MPTEPLTQWIAELKHGDSLAANQIWNHYYPQIKRRAEQQLTSLPQRAFDEEDVVQGVFLSLFRGIEHQRFPRLNDRSDLWQIVLMLLHQKVVERVRYETRQKRGAGKVRGESAWITVNASDPGIHQVPSEYQSVDVEVAFEEQLQHLLSLLPSSSLKQVAELRVQGYSNQEISERTQLTIRSVERKLSLIRSKWSASLSED